MGVLIMNQWGSLLALASAAYVIWAGLWGIFYRKFFWDIIGGTLGPAGIIPPPSAKFFVTIIVDFPILQIVNILNGIITITWEWPLPWIKDTALYRSFAARVAFYLFCGVIAMLPYQTIDAGVFYAITAAVFAKAVSLGEVMEEAKANRGKGGQV